MISSPFLLSAIVQHHLSKTESNIAEEIEANVYVDNFLVGAGNLADALKLYEEAKEIFNNAPMNLLSWSSNEREFYECLPEKDRADLEKQKCLGLQWNTTSDTLHVNAIPPMSNGETVNTKR